MKAITRNTAAQAYQALFSVMLDHGEDFTSEDGAPCLIAPGRETIVVHINNPTCDLWNLIDLSPLGPHSMEYYREQLVEGKHIKKDNPEEEAEYTYYQRLREYGVPYAGIDQIKNITSKIECNPSTRRAVAVTWQPYNDSHARDPPCMDLLKFNVWKGKLNLTVVFRSHDLIGGWLNNVYALIYLLKEIAESLNLKVGFLEIVSCDGHFYKNDQDKIDKIKAKLGMR